MSKIQKIVIVAVLFAGSIASADQRKHEEKYCAALSSLNDDFVKLNSIGPSSTVHDLRAVIDQIHNDSKDVQKQASRIGTPTAGQFGRATDRLASEASSIPDDLTIDQARDRIHQDVSNVKRTARALAQEAGCSDVMFRDDSRSDATTKAPPT